MTGEQVHLVRCRLRGKNLSTISSYFNKIDKDLNHALKEGNALEVQGKLKVTAEGQLEFDVIKIAPIYSRSGKIFRSDQATIERLRKAGVPPERLDSDRIYLQTEASPTLDVVPKKIMIISADGSEGRADIRHAMADIEKYGDAEVNHESVPWRSNLGFAIFEDVLMCSVREQYDLILVTAGGGRWNWLRHYNRAEVAEAIHRCPVSIATAIGHKKTVTMADLAADYAFITPTAAGEAIRKTLGAAYRERQEQQRNSKIRPTNTVTNYGKASGTELRLQSELAETRARAHRAETVLSQQSELLKVFRYRQLLYFHSLIDTILVAAEHRARITSQLIYSFIFAGTLSMLLFQYPLLNGLFNIESGWIFFWFSSFTLGIGAIFFWFNKISRKKIYELPPKRKNVPAKDLQGWILEAQRVRTVLDYRMVRAMASKLNP